VKKKKLENISLPAEVYFSRYKVRPPLIKPSKIYEMGGWVINFAVGCTFGCKFCYVDNIHKKFSKERIGNIVMREWGYYFLVPENMEEAIRMTRWEKWRGKKVMMSSTHDAYLPQLYRWARKILEKALPAGVGINILTRSPLVERDFDLLEKFREQVSVSVSIATMDQALSRIIEPRAVSPIRRLDIIRKAKERGIRTGIHIAPIMPPNRLRKDIEKDLEELARHISETKPDYVSAEALHARGINILYLEQAIGEKITLDNLEQSAREALTKAMRKYSIGFSWS
jgi:DNA repair photolyase